MDPALIDLLWEIHTELGSREPIHIISGYRSRSTNEMLRKTVGGQASQSRHILGKAADVHFPDVPLKMLRYSALIRERGGVGYYPTSAIPFVHVDTDRVRAWPRLPRFELALLFPNGKTQHQPAEGGPIGPQDVRIAHERHMDIAGQVAEYLDVHKGVRAPVLVADAGGADRPDQPQQVAGLSPSPAAAASGGAPRLVSEPRLAQRSPQLTDQDRARLTQLAAMATPPAIGHRPADETATMQLASLGASDRASAASAAGSPGESGWSSGWAVSADYDDDHPEELAYRPFPIAPFLTESPSPDDPALAVMVHPDAAKTLELLDQMDAAPAMRLRPGEQLAQLIWAQEFRGEAVATSALFAKAPEPRSAGLWSRPVKTAGQGQEASLIRPQ
jgi:hypothetical protein